jgi:hypothetical protein
MVATGSFVIVGLDPAIHAALWTELRMMLRGTIES